jgi:hypothetical protein
VHLDRCAHDRVRHPHRFNLRALRAFVVNHLEMLPKASSRCEPMSRRWERRYAGR